MLATTLALDLGTQTGFALLANGKIVSGSKSFHPSRFSGGGMRFLQFRHWLDDLKTKADIRLVFFEAVRRHLGVDAAHVYGGFLAHLTAWCEDHEIAYQGVGVGVIKKFMTGLGHASKEAMLQAARDKGFDPVDDNEADALAILFWSQEHAK